MGIRQAKKIVLNDRESNRKGTVDKAWAVFRRHSRWKVWDWRSYL